MMTPRENLLATLGGREAGWIPLCPYLFPNENPVLGVPGEMKGVLDSSSGDLARDIIAFSRYLGAEDWMLETGRPAELVSATCSEKTEREGEDRTVKMISTPAGELRQVTVKPDGGQGMVVERFIKTADDLRKMIAWFEGMEVATDQGKVARTGEIGREAGDSGILFARLPGTPLGMCYRLYANLDHLVYLVADEPGLVQELFRVMEEKYFALFERIILECPEIDAFFAMDDTSTTLISPAMFERHNLELTNRRADLCRGNGRLYLHHSCGLVRDLLPVYRRTGMNGVDALAIPPLGNVTLGQAREIIGPGFSFKMGLGGNLLRPASPGAPRPLGKPAVEEYVEKRMAEAREAGHVCFGVGGRMLYFEEVAAMFEAARRFQR